MGPGTAPRGDPAACGTARLRADSREQVMVLGQGSRGGQSIRRGAGVRVTALLMRAPLQEAAAAQGQLEGVQPAAACGARQGTAPHREPSSPPTSIHQGAPCCPTSKTWAWAECCWGEAAGAVLRRSWEVAVDGPAPATPGCAGSEGPRARWSSCSYRGSHWRVMRAGHAPPGRPGWLVGVQARQVPGLQRPHCWLSGCLVWCLGSLHPGVTSPVLPLGDPRLRRGRAGSVSNFRPCPRWQWSGRSCGHLLRPGLCPTPRGGWQGTHRPTQRPPGR